jgi:hypothetical protein
MKTSMESKGTNQWLEKIAGRAGKPEKRQCRRNRMMKASEMQTDQQTSTSHADF